MSPEASNAWSAEEVAGRWLTRTKARNLKIMRDLGKATAPLIPLVGVKSLNVPTLTEAE